MSQVSAAVVWSQTLADNLFQAERRRLQVKLETLVRKNQEATQDGAPGFLYGGTWFQPVKDKSPPVGHRPMLHMGLCDEMEGFLAERKRIRIDYDQIRQTLAKLLMGYDELQDMRDALPDCVVHFDPNLSRIPRQKTEAFSIRQDERALRQYHKVQPLMAMYAATHLIY